LTSLILIFPIKLDRTPSETKAALILSRWLAEGSGLLSIQNMPPPPEFNMRYLERTYPEIVPNLALDEALLIQAEEIHPGPAMRVWEAHSPAVVLGASGRRSEDVLIEACERDGIPITRRSSGGGTVLIGPGALNVTWVLPIDYAPGLASVDVAQRYVLERTAESLREHTPGVKVLGLGDLTLDQRKFSGSAQRRLRDHFMVHTSILYHFPLELITRYTALPRRQPDYRNQRPHADFLINLPLGRDTLLRAIMDAWMPDGPVSELLSVSEDRVRELVETKFSRPDWIERL